MAKLDENTRARKTSNRPKTKAIARVGRQVDFPAQREALAVLAPSDFGLLALLQTLSDGWRTTVEWLASQLDRSLATVYRALNNLKAKGYLVELNDGRLVVRWRPEVSAALPEVSAALPEVSAALPTESQKCEPTRATTTFEKENPEARASSTPAKPTTDNRQPKAPKMSYNADDNGRPKLDRDSPDRMDPTEYNEHWLALNGRFKMHWTPRDMHALDHWTRDELLTAFEATSKANFPGWRYFAAVLERIAKGETEAPRRRLAPEHPDEGRLDDYREHTAPDPDANALAALRDLKASTWSTGGDDD